MNFRNRSHIIIRERRVSRRVIRGRVLWEFRNLCHSRFQLSGNATYQELARQACWSNARILPTQENDGQCARPSGQPNSEARSFS